MKIELKSVPREYSNILERFKNSFEVRKALEEVAEAAFKIKESAMYDDDTQFKIERNEFYGLCEALKKLDDARRG